MVHRNPTLIRRDANKYQKHAFIMPLLKASSTDGEAKGADLKDKLQLCMKVVTFALYITRSHNDSSGRDLMHYTKGNNC